MAHHRGNIPYQQQNDLLENELSNKAKQLKQVAIKIGDVTRAQNKMLSEMVWAHKILPSIFTMIN